MRCPGHPRTLRPGLAAPQPATTATSRTVTRLGRARHLDGRAPRSGLSRCAVPTSVPADRDRPRPPRRSPRASGEAGRRLGTGALGTGPRAASRPAPAVRVGLPRRACRASASRRPLSASALAPVGAAASASSGLARTGGLGGRGFVRLSLGHAGSVRVASCAPARGPSTGLRRRPWPAPAREFGVRPRLLEACGPLGGRCVRRLPRRPRATVGLRGAAPAATGGTVRGGGTGAGGRHGLAGATRVRRGRLASRRRPASGVRASGAEPPWPACSLTGDSLGAVTLRVGAVLAGADLVGLGRGRLGRGRPCAGAVLG